MRVVGVSKSTPAFLIASGGYDSSLVHRRCVRIAERIESYPIILDIRRPVVNCGSIMDCNAWLFVTRGGEISQSVRASLAAEAMAVSYGIDILQRARVYWYEVLFGQFVSQFIFPTDQRPAQRPFQRCETHEKAHRTQASSW